VKALYRNECQVCGDRLDTRVGPYSEAAHIRGLGAPHDGPDVLANVLCLCSNADLGFFYTVGLTAASRSELCLSALSPPLSAHLLNAAVKIHLGAELKHGDEIHDLSSVPLRVISAPEVKMNVARALYGPRAHAVQLVWPDDEGSWPPSSRMAQRLFGEPWW